MERHFLVLLWLACGLPNMGWAQEDEDPLLVADDYRVSEELVDDPSPQLHRFDRYNHWVGGEEVRLCEGRPCNGWQEDRYADGTLQHRGLYAEGRLQVYKNYHPTGEMERDFKLLDANRSVLRTYDVNGGLRSEARYVNGVMRSYEDRYPNGSVRFIERRHPKEPYYIKMDLYAADGKPISILRLSDRRRLLFELLEYHPDGTLKSEGRARYDQGRQGSVRIGTWRYFDLEGNVEREEEYVDGKVHVAR